jgi:CheY-like chemotaxis protein
MERQTSSEGTEQQPDAVTETLERLEVADTLQDLRRHIDDLIEELSEKERASASSSEVSPELEHQIESLGDKVESASDLLAELTDLLEAQTERIETIEQQLGEPDHGAHIEDLRSSARGRDTRGIPTFAMRSNAPAPQQPPQPLVTADPTVLLREYLDIRLERLEVGIRQIELRVSEIRGAAEERDRQVRELEERLLILVDSGISGEPVRERGGSIRDAVRERVVREHAAERMHSAIRRTHRMRVVRAPIAHVSAAAVDEMRPPQMPLAAHRTASSARPGFRGRRVLENGGVEDAAIEAPLAVMRFAGAPTTSAPQMPLRVASLPAPPPPPTERGFETRASAAPETPAGPAVARKFAPPLTPETPAVAPTVARSEPQPAPLRDLERLVERDIKLRHDFDPGAADAVRPAKAHPTVLVVDDAPDALRLLSIYLSKTGYQVVTASSAEDGLAKLRHHHIDAIVLDAKMPGASGAHVCRVLRGDPAYGALRKVPVIVYTGYPDEFSRETSAEWGATEYVVKGGDMLPLISALVRHTTPRS